VEPEIACKNGLITTPDGDFRAFRPAYYNALTGNGKILLFCDAQSDQKDLPVVVVLSELTDTITDA
jgi:hypothetical protein